MHWRDPLTWVSIVVLLAVGFGGGYAVWWRTWQADQARELDWYVNTSQLHLRDFGTWCDTFFNSRDLNTLARLSLSASSLNGTLMQLPTRGPADWKAEMVLLANTINGRLRAVLDAQISNKDEEVLASVAENLPALRDRLHDLDVALERTVVHANQQPKRADWSAEVTEGLLAALRAAYQEAAKLPES